MTEETSRRRLHTFIPSSGWPAEHGTLDKSDATEMQIHTTGIPMLQKGPAVLIMTSHCLTRRSRDLGSLTSAVRIGTFWIVEQCVSARSLRSLCNFSSERLAMAHLISSCSRYVFVVRTWHADPTGSKNNALLLLMAGRTQAAQTECIPLRGLAQKAAA